MSRQEFAAQAESLIGVILDHYDQDIGFGSMTCSIYDTAWVACVSKSVDGCLEWLIPSSFTYVLQSQSTIDGGWPVAGGSATTDILTALAALHSLLIHSSILVKPELVPREHLDERIQKATSYTNNKLQHWDPINSVGVGFEILIPSLLQLCRNHGCELHFPAEQQLQRLRDQKLSRINLEMVNETSRTSLLHSLEGFATDPKFDYDKVSHHIRGGSLMGSPSATAAYLMYSSHRDETAEEYLRTAFRYGAGKGNGGLPSAFPSTNFEILWVTSTLFEAGLTVQDLSRDRLNILIDTITQSRDSETGLFGFAPFIQPDCDDTAKASVVLGHLGRPDLCRELTYMFETSTHFRTYPGELNASFSANCNALHALLLGDKAPMKPAIIKLIRFLLDYWNDVETAVSDKWNLSNFYSFMLMSQALMRVLQLSERGELKTDSNLLCEIELALWQCLMRTLLAQDTSGSWGSNGPREETSYAICTLACLWELPYVAHIHSAVHGAMDRGLDFLSTFSDKGPEHVWVEKTPFGSHVISQAYVLAAKNMASNTFADTSRLHPQCLIDTKQVERFSNFMSLLPILEDTPKWILRAAYVESKLWSPIIQHHRPQIFDREGFTQDKYLDYIPLIWSIANCKTGYCQASRLLQNMMIVSVLNYQVDEYMETLIDKADVNGDLNIRNAVLSLFECPLGLSRQENARIRQAENEWALAGPAIHDRDTADSDRPHNPLAPLRSLRNVLLQHPCVMRSTADQQKHIETEFKEFLLAHVAQIEDNTALHVQRQAKQQTPVSVNSQRPTRTKQPNGNGHLDRTSVTPSTHTPYMSNKTFVDWLLTISSTHTSCPYSFELFSAFAAPAPSRNTSSDSSSEAGARLFPDLPQQSLATRFARHLAVVCRLQNDAGSIARDRLECNLNSVDFPEFAGLKETEARERLLEMAHEEKQQMSKVKEELFNITGVSTRTKNMLELFRMVTEMFGEVYIAKDIASRRTQTR